MRSFTLAIGVAALALGCSKNGNEAVGLRTTGATTGDAREHVCPMAVPGSAARAVDVPGGVALELTTSASEADARELTRRAHVMAGRAALGRIAGPGGGLGKRGQRRAAEPPPASRVRLEDLPRGVRVVLLAQDPAQVDLLRARAHAHAAHMARGECAQP